MNVAALIFQAKLNRFTLQHKTANLANHKFTVVQGRS